MCKNNTIVNICKKTLANNINKANSKIYLNPYANLKNYDEYSVSIQKTLNKNNNKLYFEFRSSQQFYYSDKNIG